MENAESWQARGFGSRIFRKDKKIFLLEIDFRLFYAIVYI